MILINPNTPEYSTLRSGYYNLTREYQFVPGGVFVGGMPVTLERDCLRPLLNENVYVTLKVDGERYLLFIFNKQLYFISRSLQMYYIDRSFFSVDNCLFDSEVVVKNSKPEIFIFDCLYYSSTNLIPTDYYNRLDVINKFIEGNNQFKVKKWFKLSELLLLSDNIYSYVVKNTPVNKIESDGLIIQNFKGSYITSGPWIKKNNIQFKWKPLNKQTVDFKIKIESPNTWVLLTKNGNPYMVNQKNGNPLPAICRPTASNKNTFVDGDVAEFKLVANNVFKIDRPRINKEANSIPTVMSVMNFLANPFTLDVLKTDNKLSLLTTDQLILSICSKVDNVLFFTKNDIQIIKENYDKIQNPLFEFEIRFYKSGNVSGGGVRKYVFDNLFEYYSKEYPRSYVNTVDIIRDSYRSEYYLNENKVLVNTNNLNKVKYDIYTENVGNIKELISYSKNLLLNKEALSSEIKSMKSESKFKEKSYNGINYKFGLSTESKSKIIVKEYENGKYNLVRAKNRVSFFIGEQWRLDLTVVKQGYSLRQAYSSNDSYEVELEYIGNNQNILNIQNIQNIDTFIKMANSIITELLIISNNC